MGMRYGKFYLDLPPLTYKGRTHPDSWKAKNPPKLPLQPDDYENVQLLKDWEPEVRNVKEVSTGQHLNHRWESCGTKTSMIPNSPMTVDKPETASEVSTVSSDGSGSSRP